MVKYVNVKMLKMSLKEEQTGKFHMYTGKGGLILPENSFQRDIEKMKEDKEKEEALTILRNLDDLKQKEIEDTIQELELLPEGNKIIILPYPTNPYKKIKQGSIYLGNNGSFKNPDSGEMDTLAEFVSCAKIIEIGPNCVQAKVGDDLFFIKNAAMPLPFMSLGYLVVNEPNVVSFIGKRSK